MESPPTIVGLALKAQLVDSLRGSGYEVVDFGAHAMDLGDGYPDFIIQLANPSRWELRIRKLRLS